MVKKVWLSILTIRSYVASIKEYQLNNLICEGNQLATRK